MERLRYFVLALTFVFFSFVLEKNTSRSNYVPRLFF